MSRWALVLALLSACSSGAQGDAPHSTAETPATHLPTCRPHPWPWDPPRHVVPKVIGFSRAGWMAFTELNVWQDEEELLTSVQHLSCSDECMADTPTFQGDLCYCPPPGEDLVEEFRITPTSGFESGTFPATIDGTRYEVQTELQIGPGIAPGSTTEFTVVRLRTGAGAPQTLGSVNDHATSFVELVCVAGWFRSADHPDYLQVVVGYGDTVGGETPDVVRYKIMGAQRREGVEP